MACECEKDGLGHAWGCEFDFQSDADDESESSDDGGGGGEEAAIDRPAKKAKLEPGPQAVPKKQNRILRKSSFQVSHVSHGPNYPQGIVQHTHPGEYDHIFSTCNRAREHTEDGTLSETMDEECACTDGFYHGSGFDTGLGWQTKPHVVYIDSDLWRGFSIAQKTLVTDRANLACKTCGKTNTVFITDVFGKGWASD